MAGMSRIRDVMMEQDGGDQEMVRQGFICPICLLDLGEVHQLQAHFSAEHHADANGESDQLFGQMFGGLRGKLVGKLAQIGMQPSTGDAKPTPVGRSTSVPQAMSALAPAQNVVLNVDQPLGACTSHTRDLRTWREQQINDDEVETNKLIIRLDKLINNTPDDALKRKGA